MTGPSTSPEAWDQFVDRALAAACDAGANEGSLNAFEMSAALADVAPDIAAQAKRECAEEMLGWASAIEIANIYDDPTITSVVRELRSLAASWSGSGRTPAGEERETVEELNEGER